MQPTDPLEEFGFVTERDVDQCVYLKDGADPSMRDALTDPDKLEPLSTDGRAQVYRVPLPDGDAVVRPYRRGGAVAAFSTDTYQGGDRAKAELVALSLARARGVRAPEPLGGVWERRGKGYGGAIATRLVPGVTLEQASRELDSDQFKQVCERCGVAIRELHDAGIYHADLQIRNILVHDATVTLIDFDGAMVTSSLSPIERARNLLRLRRSIEKNKLPQGGFDAICLGYGPVSLPWWLRAGYRIKSQLSDLLRSGAS